MRLNQLPLPPGTFLAKQYADALIDLLRYRLKPGSSFSQHGEDSFLCGRLKSMISTGFYVDVGANHPSKLSNTFKLYKLGMRGVAIEPNPAMCRVYEVFRPHDVCLCFGLGISEDLKRLKVAKYHGLSTFSSHQSRSSPISHSRYVPLTTLKRVLETVRLPGRAHFALLSVDCEGWDELVLQGNDWTKHRPMYIITEFGSRDSRDRLMAYLSKQHYSLESVIGCNLLFSDLIVCANDNANDEHDEHAADCTSKISIA